MQYPIKQNTHTKKTSFQQHLLKTFPQKIPIRVTNYLNIPRNCNPTFPSLRPNNAFGRGSPNGGSAGPIVARGVEGSTWHPSPQMDPLKIDAIEAWPGQEACQQCNECKELGHLAHFSLFGFQLRKQFLAVIWIILEYYYFFGDKMSKG